MQTRSASNAVYATRGVVDDRGGRRRHTPPGTRCAVTSTTLPHCQQCNYSTSLPFIYRTVRHRRAQRQRAATILARELYTEANDIARPVAAAVWTSSDIASRSTAAAHERAAVGCFVGGARCTHARQTACGAAEQSVDVATALAEGTCDISLARAYVSSCCPLVPRLLVHLSFLFSLYCLKSHSDLPLS